MTGTFKLVLLLIFAAGMAARGDFRENFESFVAGQSIAGQQGWDERAFGSHPSAVTIKGGEPENVSKVLQGAGKGDCHVFHKLTAEQQQQLKNAAAVLIRVRYCGLAAINLGNFGKYGKEELSFKLGPRLSIRIGDRTISGIGNYAEKKWHDAILAILRQPDGSFRLKATVLPESSSNKELSADPAIASAAIAATELQPDKWTALGVRLDNYGSIDDISIQAFASQKDLPVSFSTSEKITTMFSPILDHLLAPRHAVDLDGLWEAVSVTSAEVPPPASGWQTVLVPDRHNSLFSGKTPCVWFRRDFDLKKKETGRRYYLCFERVTNSCEILVNGQSIGKSDDGYFPFRLDATEALKAGKNEISVIVSGTAATGGATRMPAGWPWLLPQFDGINYPVHIESTGEVTIDDAFLIPRLAPHTELESRVTVKNHGTGSATVKIEASAGADFSYAPQNLTLKPGECREVVMTHAWKNPKLWWPHSPHLYNLDFKVSSNGKVVDAFRQRFGFREIKVVGPDMLLNGVRFMHRRTSIIPYWNLTTYDEQKKMIDILKTRGYNGYRLHGGPSLRIVRCADELGWLIAPESGINEPRGHEVDNKFWANAEKHIASMVKTLRNHPSVIYWCLSNEFASYYMKGSVEEKAAVDAKMTALGQLAEKLDPQHTWTCSGDGELGGQGKHGPAPTVSFHYPTEPFKQKFTIPNNINWLEDATVSWQGIKWDRKKPLHFSEDLFMPYCIHPPFGMARWAGDAAYDMKEGYYRGWFDCIQMFSTGYYHAGLSVWNPWGTAAEEKNNPLYSYGQPMPDYLIDSREQNSTFASAERIKRTLMIYNAMFEEKDCVLQGKLTKDGKVIGQTIKNFKLPAGIMKSFDLVLDMPKVAEKSNVQWDLELKAGEQTLCRKKFDYHVFPAPTSFKAPDGCILLSTPSGIFANVVFPGGRFSQLNQALAAGAKSLVIAGWKSSGSQDTTMLNAAVKNGLRVLWLEPDHGEILPLRRNVSGCEAFAFVRAPGDPAVQGIDDSDLKAWRTEGYTVQAPFYKPTEGAFDILADAGTGLEYTVLSRVYDGQGQYLLCSLPLVSAFGKEPAAAWLTSTLIRSLESNNTRQTQKISVLYASDATTTALGNLGITYTRDNFGKVSWIDAEKLASSAIEKLKKLGSGDVAIIAGVDEKSAAVIAKLCGKKIRVAPQFATGLLKKNNNDPLLAGISNDDLFWRQKEDFFLEAASIVQNRPYSSKDQSMIDTAIIGGDDVHIPTIPGGIAIIPFRQGHIVLLTLKWREFIKIHPARVSRLMLTLLHNLGADTASTRKINREYCFINMKPLMNREFWQKNEKTPAWFGVKDEDFRYFPVNRPGIDPVLKLPQPPEAFPSAPLNLGGIDFQLVDPDRNQGYGCLILKPGEKIELSAAGKYNGLWLLGALERHAGNREPVAELIYNYSDGSSAVVPILSKIHVNGYQYIPDSSSAVCAWMGYSSQRADNVLWCWLMANPHPEKAVGSATIKVGKTCALALIAATAEK